MSFTSSPCECLQFFLLPWAELSDLRQSQLLSIDSPLLALCHGLVPGVQERAHSDCAVCVPQPDSGRSRLLPTQLIPYHQYTVNAVIGALLLGLQCRPAGAKGVPWRHAGGGPRKPHHPVVDCHMAGDGGARLPARSRALERLLQPDRDPHRASYGRLGAGRRLFYVFALPAADPLGACVSRARQPLQFKLPAVFAGPPLSMPPPEAGHDPPLAVWPYTRPTKTSKALRRPSKPAGCFCVATLFLRAPLHRPRGACGFERPPYTALLTAVFRMG